ncbi:MAG: CocE/NonD family hydrolase, partial [Actinomycetota bacterium]|nr:CocE/NonD family hydrolase [Actinomycetota bacterium]
MRRHWRLAAVLSVLMLSSVTAPFASTASASTKSYSSQTVSYSIPTKYGHIYLEVERPVDPSNPDKVVKAPTILTYSPYAILEGRNSDASSWVPQGYARAWADVVGTGNSGGCFDYGGKSEGITGNDVVEFIAKQKWSNGKVGMLGGSYDGTTQWATAVTQPPHLTTIVPEAAIDRWYDYAYSGGIRYLDNNEAPREGPGAPADEGVDTPLAFDFGLAVPPPTDTSDPDWATRTQERIRPCDQLEHTQKGYNDQPDYDKFWMERDYIHDANKIDIPVLISANWGDWNVKQQQSVDMFNALHNSPDKKLYMGNAFSGHGVPGGDYNKFVHEWFDHYLMGVNNGVQNAPQVHSQTSNYDGPQGWYAGSWPK